MESPPHPVPLYSRPNPFHTSDGDDVASDIEVDIDPQMEGYDPSLFVPESQSETFVIGDVELKVVCSKAAVTDYDATGLIVWPASRVLAWYLKQSDVVRGRHVMELGAGCGLTGLAAHSFGAESVTLTDGNADVVKLLNQTCTLNHLSSEDVHVQSLEWGDRDAAEKLIAECGRLDRWPTVVLGADVFHTSFGSPSLLFATVKRIFLAVRGHVDVDCVFYTCYALRQSTKDELIQQCAKDEGFLGEKLCIRDMLPQGMHPDDFTREKLRLTAYRLKE